MVSVCRWAQPAGENLMATLVLIAGVVGDHRRFTPDSLQTALRFHHIVSWPSPVGAVPASQRSTTIRLFIVQSRETTISTSKAIVSHQKNGFTLGLYKFRLSLDHRPRPCRQITRFIECLKCGTNQANKTASVLACGPRQPASADHLNLRKNPNCAHMLDDVEQRTRRRSRGVRIQGISGGGASHDVERCMRC